MSLRIQRFWVRGAVENLVFSLGKDVKEHSCFWVRILLRILCFGMDVIEGGSVFLFGKVC